MAGGGKREGFVLQNVNVLLGGTMLAGLVLLVCLVCCCCRFTATRKPADSPSSYWLQDAVMSPDDEEPPAAACERELEEQQGIYSLDLQSSRSTVGVWPSPPPPYSALRFSSVMASSDTAGSSASLPSYEAALQQRSALHL